jgi:hypothetical protein
MIPEEHRERAGTQANDEKTEIAAPSHGEEALRAGAEEAEGREAGSLVGEEEVAGVGAA